MYTQLGCCCCCLSVSSISVCVQKGWAALALIGGSPGRPFPTPPALIVCVEKSRRISPLIIRRPTTADERECWITVIRPIYISKRPVYQNKSKMLFLICPGIIVVQSSPATNQNESIFIWAFDLDLSWIKTIAQRLSEYYTHTHPEDYITQLG